MPTDEMARLLLVDDHESSVENLTRRLQRLGHRVITAVDGESALRLLAEEPFDLVMVDITNPGVDGAALVPKLRRLHTATQLPVIVASSAGDGMETVKALHAGANDYVTKPFDFALVLARVQTHLRMKRAVDEVVRLEQDVRRKNEELQAAFARIKQDLEAAARIQQSLLPTAAPKAPGVQFAWYFRPCDELGGDTLNAFRLDEHHVGFYVLDVSGHGVPASMLSVSLSRLLQPGPIGASPLKAADSVAGYRLVPPADVAKLLNDRFPMDVQTQQYFTFFYGVLDVATRELRYVRAGHPGPILLRFGGGHEELGPCCPPIGMVRSAEYTEGRVQLESGDRLYVYSDGVTEARSATEEEFGGERLVEHMEGAWGRTLEESVREVVSEIEEWCRPRLPDDDVTMLAIELAGA